MYINRRPESGSVFAALIEGLTAGNNGDKGGRFSRETYKSFIGIVVAICGNVLISVALNTQRYAHIKLNEQAAARRKLLKRAERRNLETSQELDDEDRLSAKDDTGQARRKPAASNRHARSQSEDDEHQPLLNTYRPGFTEIGGNSDSHTKQEDETSQKSYLKSPYWWIGIVLMIIGEGGNFLAYGFAPASIVSPLGVVAIISNCIIAPIFLKEPFRWRDFFGVVVAVGGAVTVVMSASESNPKLGPHEIWDLIARWEFETYLGITIALIVCLLYASNKYGQKSVFIDLGLVGLFGGYTALSTKGVASLLSYTLFKALTFPVFYLLVTILVGTAIMQIKYVNRALQRFDSTQVIPTQFVMFTLSVIIGSAVLYRDFEKTRGDAAGKFIGGCAMTFIGVWLITSGRPPASDEEDDDDYDSDEDAIVLRPGEQYQDDINVNAASQETLTQPPLISIDEDNDNFDSVHNLSRQPSSIYGGTNQRFDRHSSDMPVRPSSFSRDSHQPRNYSYHDNSQRPSPIRSQTALQRFLQPLATLFPQESAKHTSQALPSVLKARHSTPALPTTSSTSLQEPPRTPRQASHDGTTNSPLTTPGPSKRNRLINRHSLNNLYPGPFTSPLSSSLSAMVSDSLRRGMSIKRMRRRSTRPRLNQADSSTSHAQQFGPPSMPEHNNNNENGPLLPAFDDGAAGGYSPSRSRSYTNDEYYDDDAREIEDPETPDANNNGRSRSSSSRRRSLGSRVGDFFRRTPKNNGKAQDSTNDVDDDDPLV